VDVVSRYAGGALPEPARGRVRGFILDLPQRWAKKAPGSEEVDRDRDREREMERESVAAASGSAVSVRRGHRRRGRGTAASSAASSRAASPITTMRPQRHQDEGGESVSASTANLAAQRILTLATESLDMMRGVTGVVKDSLDRADACVSISFVDLIVLTFLILSIGGLVVSALSAFNVDHHKVASHLKMVIPHLPTSAPLAAPSRIMRSS